MPKIGALIRVLGGLVLLLPPSGCARSADPTGEKVFAFLRLIARLAVLVKSQATLLLTLLAPPKPVSSSQVEKRAEGSVVRRCPAQLARSASLILPVAAAQLNPHPVGNAGTYTGTADRAFLDFTASSPGRIFARLIPTSTADKAIIAYEEGFDPATSDRNYVEIGMVTAN